MENMAPEPDIVVTQVASAPAVDQVALTRAQAKIDNDKADALTDKEQAALDAQTAFAREVRGYDTFLYHGVTMWRILEAPDRTFETEREAAAFVTAMRTAHNQLMP